MKKFFEKMKSYGFWVALASATVVLVNSIGKLCGFSIENKVVEDVILSIAGLLAVFGIVNMNSKKGEKQEEQKENPHDQIEESNDQNLTNKDE